jgi:hypothetical protein
MDRSLFTIRQGIALEFMVSVRIYMKLYTTCVGHHKMDHNGRFKLLLFCFHFGFSIFLLNWYSNNKKCGTGNRGAMYTQTSINALELSERYIEAVYVSEKDQAYSYYQNYTAIFSKESLLSRCTSYQVLIVTCFSNCNL